MHRIFYRHCYFLLLATLIWSCSKDKIDFISAPDRQVQAGVVIQVQDETGVPVSQAQVRLGGQTYLTDLRGLVDIDVTTLHSANNTLRVNRAGYFESYSDFNIQTGEMVAVQTILYKIDKPFRVEAGKGGMVDMPGGLRITFSEKAFTREESDESYAGEVSVALRYIDPGASDFARKIPVRLAGLAPDGSPRILNSIGFLQLELSDPTGRKLGLKPGSAMVSIPANAMHTSLNTAIWHYDPQTGFWTEQDAVKSYEGRLSAALRRDGYLSLAVSEPAIRISGKLTDLQGRPFNYMDVVIRSEHGAFDHFKTDSEGGFGGYVAKDAELTLSLQALCGEVYYTVPLGTLGRNTELGNLNLDMSHAGRSLVAVSAILQNCNGQPLPRGLARWAGFNTFFPANDKGELNVLIPLCEAAGNGKMIISDPLTGNTSAELSLSYPASHELGLVAVCHEVREYVMVNAPGLQLNNVNLYAELDLYTDTTGQIKNLFAYTSDNQLRLNISLKWKDAGTSYHTGSYAVTSGRIYGEHNQNIDGQVIDARINILKGGQPGEIIEGTFEGKIELRNNPGLSTLNGSFRIRGQ